jgi:hypothetical protein
VGDTIQITYLGFNDTFIPITKDFINCGDTVIRLSPTSYSLDDIIIKSKHKFDAAKFFKSKKLFLLLPYDDKRTVSVYAKINYIGEDGNAIMISPMIDTALYMFNLFSIYRVMHFVAFLQK